MKRRRLLDRGFTVMAATAASGALVVLFGLIGLVVVRGAGAIDWTFFTEQVRSVGAEGGVLYHIVGTIILITTAALVAVPVAAGAGVFMEGYLHHGSVRRLLESGLQALNAVPSIVFGLVGFALFFHYLEMGKSWLSGGILLGVMILPTVTLAFVEKLRSIPPATIEAAAGLGLRRSSIVRAILIPQAASGLVTGTLLGLARAAGETAPIMFTAVIFAGATVPKGITESPVLALPYHIFVLAQDSFDSAAVEKVWGTAIVLILLVLALSFIALPLRLKIHEEARRV